MSAASTSAARIWDHPRDLRGVVDNERDGSIISTRTIEGRCMVLSRYADSRWHLPGQPTNKTPADQIVNFDVISPVWHEPIKAILYRYLCRGRDGQKRPSPRGVVKLFRDACPFLRHLDRLGITRLADVTPMVCAIYADACKSHRQSEPAGGRPLKASSLGHRFGAVEALHELSQHTDDAMALHPWPGTSATHLAGLTGRGSGHRGGQTPLMPDEVFTGLFQRAWSLIEDADALDSGAQDEHGDDGDGGWTGEAGQGLGRLQDAEQRQGDDDADKPTRRVVLAGVNGAIDAVIGIDGIAIWVSHGDLLCLSTVWLKNACPVRIVPI